MCLKVRHKPKWANGMKAFINRNLNVFLFFLLVCLEQTKLEKIVTEKMCRSVVYEVLRGVQTPERPGSPAELYLTEEEKFGRKNPKVNPTPNPTAV